MNMKLHSTTSFSIFPAWDCIIIEVFKKGILMIHRHNNQSLQQFGGDLT